MGSYRCAVLSEGHNTYSDEGGIQLEGEFILTSCHRHKKDLQKSATVLLLKRYRTWLISFSLRPSSLLHGASAHVRSGQRLPESAMCGPRTSRASQGHLVAGWRSSKLPVRPGGPVALHTKPHRYHFSVCNTSTLNTICRRLSQIH